jgi:hypothetical protein
MAKMGNTLILTVKFYRPGTAELVDVDELVFSVYDNLPSKKITENLVSLSSAKISTGTYRIFYTMPTSDTAKKYVFEFKGKYAGMDIVDRKSELAEWLIANK